MREERSVNGTAAGAREAWGCELDRVNGGSESFRKSAGSNEGSVKCCSDESSWDVGCTAAGDIAIAEAEAEAEAERRKLPTVVPAAGWGSPPPRLPAFPLSPPAS